MKVKERKFPVMPIKGVKSPPPSTKRRQFKPALTVYKIQGGPRSKHCHSLVRNHHRLFIIPCPKSDGRMLKMSQRSINWQA
jgi:hypothetical protein